MTAYWVIPAQPARRYHRSVALLSPLPFEWNSRHLGQAHDGPIHDNRLPGAQNALRGTSGTQTGFLPLVLRIGIGISVIVFLLATISLDDIATAFSHAEIAPLLFGCLLVVPHLGLQIYKWLFLMKTISAQTRWFEAFSSLLLSIAVGSFTPGRIGEIPGRSLLVSSLSSPQSLSLSLLDKLQFFILLLMLGVPSIMLLMLPPSISRLLIMAAAVSGSLVVFFRTGLLAKLPHVLPKRWHGSWATEYEHTIASLTPSQLLHAFLLTLASYGVLSLQFFFFLRAFTGVTLLDSFLGFSAMMLAKSVFPISIADIGIREAGSVYFFALLGISSAAAFNASMVLFLINILLPSVVGLLFLPKASLVHRRDVDHTDAAVKKSIP